MNQEYERPATQREAHGDFKNRRMENAHYWAAQADGWMTDGPNAGLDGRYYVEIIGGKPVIVLDGSFNGDAVEALVDSLREYGFPTPIQVTELAEETRIFISEPSDHRLSATYDHDWRAFETTGGFLSEQSAAESEAAATAAGSGTVPSLLRGYSRGGL
jgi:hypothetical protein